MRHPPPHPISFAPPHQLNIIDIDLAVHPTALVQRGRINIIISFTHVAYSVFPFPPSLFHPPLQLKRLRPCSKEKRHPLHSDNIL